MTAQPETEHDKMICTELIDIDCAVRAGDEIKPNYPAFTKNQSRKLNELLDPFGKTCSQKRTLTV